MQLTLPRLDIPRAAFESEDREEIAESLCTDDTALETPEKNGQNTPYTPGLCNSKGRRRCLHNWWRIRSIRISSRNNGRIKKTTRLVLYQTLHYFVPDYLHFGCIVLANAISTKTLF